MVVRGRQPWCYVPDDSRSPFIGLLGDEERDEEREDDVSDGALLASPWSESVSLAAWLVDAAWLFSLAARRVGGWGSMIWGPRSSYRVVDDE